MIITHQHLLKVSENYGVDRNVKLIILACIPQKAEALAAALLRIGIQGAGVRKGRRERQYEGTKYSAEPFMRQDHLQRACRSD